MTATHSTRVYVTHAPEGGAERLVRASHPGHARAHATRVRIATQDDLIRLMGKGLQVEDASPAADEPEAQSQLAV